ncbi:MAG: hypothetical protein Tsb0020_08600 [Haliangiales bacterium]
MRTLPFAAVLLCFVLLSACRDDPGAGGEHSTSVEQDLESRNRVILNRVILNRVILNRVILNSLSDENLSHGSVSKLKKTEEGRELLLYLVRCALAEDDSLTITHKGESYQFPGLMGLATGWTEGALNATERRWVSACLIGHVNAYGVSVELSLRAPATIGASEAEMAAFPVYEATFFGDIFTAPSDGIDEAGAAADNANSADQPYEEDAAQLTAYACLGGAPDIAMAHAPSRSLRVCADPTPDCELPTLGYCRDVCETYITGFGWTDCWAEGEFYAETTSSFLRADDGLCQESCDGDDTCLLSCADEMFDPDFSGGQIYSCDAADIFCVAACQVGTCSIDASGTHLVAAFIDDGAQAEAICTDTSACIFECRGDDTTCELDCSDANVCRINRCDRGAACLIDCSGASWCEIDDCDGELKACANGVFACNRDCP